MKLRALAQYVLCILLIFSSIAGLSFAAEYAAEKIAGFAALPETDELVVEYMTSGCFHDNQYQLTFHRKKDLTVSVVEFQRQPREKGQPEPTAKRIELGQLTLQSDAIAGLDNLVKFYRSGPGEGCTTQDRITIEQHHDGKLVATEKFVDGSCRTEDMQNVTTLGSLIYQLHKQP